MAKDDTAIVVFEALIKRYAQRIEQLERQVAALQTRTEFSGTASGMGIVSTSASLPSAATVGAGAMRYITDVARPAWSDGTIWRYGDGTAV